jgi:hypothetical protein
VPVTTTALPEGAGCLVDDRTVLGTDCLSWALQTAGGSAFTLLAAKGPVVVAATTVGIVTMDTATGAVRWRWQPPSGVEPSSVLIASDRVIVTLEPDHRLVALDLDTGSVAWSIPLEDPRQTWIAVDGGAGPGTERLAVREPTRLVMIDPVDGRVVFAASLPAGGTTPLIVGPAVIATAEHQAMMAWNHTTAELLWELAVDVSTTVPPIVVGDAAVAVTRDGGLLAVDVTGVVRWRVASPHLRSLVALDKDTFAAVTSSGIRVHRASTGEVASRIAVTPLVHDAVPAGPGELLVVTGANVQRIDAGLAGETWTLQTVPARDRVKPLLVDVRGRQYVVAVLDGHRLLAAFEVPFTTAEQRQDPDCPSARPSEALGPFRAWQTGFVHVGLDPGGDDHLLPGVQLWIGMFDVDPSTVVRVSARRSDRPALAQLRNFGGLWTTEVTLTGARTAAGWPTHWVLEANFPAGGCWEVKLSAEDRTENVTIAVPPEAVTLDDPG